jgi:hypothetical protein
MQLFFFSRVRIKLNVRLVLPGRMWLKLDKSIVARDPQLSFQDRVLFLIEARSQEASSPIETDIPLEIPVTLERSEPEIEASGNRAITDGATIEQRDTVILREKRKHGSDPQEFDPKDKKHKKDKKDKRHKKDKKDKKDKKVKG